MLTARKAINVIRYETRQKRGGGQVAQASALAPDSTSSAQDVLASLMAEEPSPELATQLAEDLQRLLTRLGDQQLRDIALAKMEGYTNEEIARRVGCSLATVERRLKLIRKLWEHEAQP